MFLLLLFIGNVYCSIYAVELTPNTDVFNFALTHNSQYVDKVFNYTIFESLNNEEESFLSHDNYRKQYKRIQYTRTNDPLYGEQWHLHSEYSVDFTDQQQGENVVLAIVDDGLQHRHPDLLRNYNPSLSYDFNGKDHDPTPSNNDGHGTSAAGVAAATENNNHCGTGVAPKVSLVGLRLIGSSTYDYEEAQAMTYKNQQIHIYSCSWGPMDDGSTMSGPGHITEQALTHGATTGRGGKGSIFVWAGGNGKADQDNGNYDGYANHWATLAIGALNYSGKQSWYSEDCACLMAVTPSSGSPGRGIRTVDLVGSSGYSYGECTNSFGGTSSAAPLAAGIIALMLGKRPELTARDVQHIIAKSATQIQTSNSDWTRTNYPHSHHYGFGLLKIPKIMAETNVHTLVPTKRIIQSNIHRYNTIITTGGTTVQISIPGNLQFVEQAIVTVEYTHPRHGFIKLELIHGQVTSILANYHSDRNRGTLKWTYSSVRHWGTTSNGIWSVRIKDTRGTAGIGRLKNVQIKLIGY